jgi:DNA polymerase type B, organellar and viral
MVDYFLHRVLNAGIGHDIRSRFFFTLTSSALQRHFRNYRVSTMPNDVYGDLLLYLVDVERFLLDRLQALWREMGSLAFSLQVNIRYERETIPDDTRDTGLHTDYYQIITFQDIIPSLRAALGEIDKANTEYNDNGSDWKLMFVIDTVLYVNRIQPSKALRGGGAHFLHLYGLGRAFLDLPTWIQNKKCCVNIQNKDNLCFKYVMECAWLLQHSRRPEAETNLARPARYSNQHHFEYGDLKFPIHPLEMAAFEALNRRQHNLAINVYCADDVPGPIAIIYHTENHDDDAWIVDLLFIRKMRFDRASMEVSQVDYHWTLVKSIDRLCSGLDGVSNHRHRQRCRRCLDSFASVNSLEEHQVMCLDREAQRPKLPLPYEAYRYFKDHHKRKRREVVVYADFEAFNAVIEHKEGEMKRDSQHQTKHVASGFGMYTVFSSRPEFNHVQHESYEQSEFQYDEFHSPYTDIAPRFITALRKERDRVLGIIEKHFSYSLDPTYVDAHNERCVFCNLSMEMGYMHHWRYKSYKEQKHFSSRNEYWARKRLLKFPPVSIAHQEMLLSENRLPMAAWDPHKQYDNYIGNCHFACGSGANRIVRRSNLPVVFHNLSGYDAHLIVKALSSDELDRFSAIPLTQEKFMSFTAGGCQFIDSFRFLGTALEKLVANLKASKPDSFLHLADGIRNFQTVERGCATPDNAAIDLMIQKGEFPYEYFDRPERLNDTQLPSLSQFYSTLYDKTITESAYRHAQTVWTTMECKTLRDYHDLYLMQDIFLLADVFENFRSICLSENDLDPLWYISIPGFAYDCCFKHKGNVDLQGLDAPFEIELFHTGQTDMYLFVEDSIRGGISMTPGRYARANHKYLPNYNPALPSKHIVYLDANSLYAYAMSQFLPVGDYRWVPEDRTQSILDYCQSSEIMERDAIGYILEVDGFFPEDVHDKLSDLPPCPVKRVVLESEISPYSRSLNDRYHALHDDVSEKLLCTLEPRVKYKVHYRLLHLYMKLGFQVTQCHRVLQFQQRDWIASFITSNVRKRQMAGNDFERDLHKLVMNSNYGKFMQNNRKHRTLKAITWATYHIKNKWNPFLKQRIIVNQDLVLAYMKKGFAMLNSPVIVGTVILDHSKWLMYDYYYNQIKRVYNDRVRLLFTDTDSLCMEIRTDDFMLDVMSDSVLIDSMDLSDWPKDDSYYGYDYHDGKYMKVIAKFKDEMAKSRRYIVEVVALRSKCYSALKSDGKDKATLKGVSTTVREGGLFERGIRHADYLECLQPKLDYELVHKYVYNIQSLAHVLYTNRMKKVSLSPNDSKVYLLDATHSLPYGHKSIRGPIVPL